MLGLQPKQYSMYVEPEAVTRAKKNYRDGFISARQLAELIAGGGREAVRKNP
jgi:hypothetical protein